MPLYPPTSPRAACTVLQLAAHSVEWLERSADGGVRHARVDVADPSAGAQVRAAEEAWRAAGSSARTCVLALARPYAVHKLLTLPPIARRDLGEVFRRRAQALAGADGGQAYFTALEMRRPAAAAGPSEPQGWLLATLRESTRELRVLLRERGFHVRRVVSAELSALEWGRRHASEGAQAALVIVASEAAVTVSLVEGERLVYQEALEGDLASRPALVSGLVHEIKTCAAFWRKESRGQTLSQVLVGGLPRARVELLAVTLSSILPGASVRSIVAHEEGGEKGDDADPDGRLALLAAAGDGGALNPDLTFWLPQRRRALGLSVALAAAAATGLALFGFEQGVARVQGVREEARSLRRASADLEELGARTSAAQELLAEVEAHLGRGQAIADYGVPLERALGTVLAAFAGKAKLDQLSLLVDEDERTRLTLSGRCPDDPARLVGELRAILARLEQDPAFDELSLSLPEELGQHGELASFSIEAVLRS